MRLPKTLDGAIPESTTATPTPVPLGPAADTPKGRAQGLPRRRDRLKRRRFGVDGDAFDVGVVLEATKSATGDLRGDGLDQPMVSLHGVSAGPERAIDGDAPAAGHPDDHPLSILPLSPVVPLLEGGVDLGSRWRLRRPSGSRRPRPKPEGDDSGDPGDVVAS